jgi:hypothetical protein
MGGACVLQYSRRSADDIKAWHPKTSLTGVLLSPENGVSQPETGAQRSPGAGESPVAC